MNPRHLGDYRSIVEFDSWVKVSDPLRVQFNESTVLYALFINGKHANTVTAITDNHAVWIKFYTDQQQLERGADISWYIGGNIVTPKVNVPANPNFPDLRGNYDSMY